MLAEGPFVEIVLVAGDQATSGVKFVAYCRTYPAGLVGHKAVIVGGTLLVVTTCVTGLVTRINLADGRVTHSDPNCPRHRAGTRRGFRPFCQRQPTFRAALIVVPALQHFSLFNFCFLLSAFRLLLWFSCRSVLRSKSGGINWWFRLPFNRLHELNHA
jgi:hypothetical protein